MADDKICTRCERRLPIDKFGLRTDRRGAKYPKSRCRRCETGAKRIQRIEDRKLNPSKQCKPPTQRPAEKICRKCHQKLPVESFRPWRAVCIPCYSIVCADRRKRIKSPDYAKCDTCQQWLLLACFGKDASGDPHSKCKNCTAPDRRKSESENKKADEIAANASRADAEYDYRFARNILGLSKADALEWVARGYEDCDDDLIYDWGLHLEEAEWSGCEIRRPRHQDQTL